MTEFLKKAYEKLQFKDPTLFLIDAVEHNINYHHIFGLRQYGKSTRLILNAIEEAVSGAEYVQRYIYCSSNQDCTRKSQYTKDILDKLEISYTQSGNSFYIGAGGFEFRNIWQELRYDRQYPVHFDL